MPANGKVFISHTNDSHEQCGAIYEHLRAKEVDFWYDVHNMAPGQVTVQAEPEWSKTTLTISDPVRP
jgi:hypothetical protein